MSSEKIAYVTVGSTSFDALISTVCSQNVLETLASKKFTKLVLQIGRGNFQPPESSLIDISWYTYKDSLLGDMKSASLIISHAGAGSIIQALECGKPLIVVVNDQLMNNHQLELAGELAKQDYLKYCYCSDLCNVIDNLDLSKLKDYTQGNPDKFGKFLDSVMGYK